MLGQHLFEILTLKKINKITTVTPFKDVFSLAFLSDAPAWTGVCRLPASSCWWFRSVIFEAVVGLKGLNRH